MPNGRDLNMQVMGETGADIQMNVDAGGDAAAVRAEKWANGTANGVPVPASANPNVPTSENNAKYWAQQAQSAASDSTKYPKVQGGTWWYWDAVTQQYVDSGYYASFHIVKSYASISAMNADFSGTDVKTGEMVMVVNTVEDPDNAKIYIKEPTEWHFLVDLSGATGIQGPIGVTPQFSIGTVTGLSHGASPTTSVDNTDPTHPVLNLGIPAGASGNETIDDTAGIGDTDLVYSADKVRRELDTKAPVVDVPLATPASVQSFSDGADDLPMALTVGVEPVQDLHGYDNPWPAGGGKNLLPNEITTATEYGITFTTMPDGKTRVTGTSTTDIYKTDICENFSLPEGTYIFSYDPVTSVNIQICNRSENNEYLRITASAPSKTLQVTSAMVNDMRVRFLISPGVTVSNAVTGVMIRLSTESDATFAPYSNICSISGWTGANVTRTGKNLLKLVGQTQKISGVQFTVNSDGTITANGTALANVNYVVGEFRISDNSVILSGSIGGSGNTYYLQIVNDTQTTQIGVAYDGDETIQIAANTTYLCRIRIISGVTLSNVTFKPMVRCISEPDSTFEPFGTVYPITFPSEAGTVYGGTLTVNKDGSGELVVDKAEVDLGTLTYGKNTALTGVDRFGSGIQGILNPANIYIVPNILCSMFKTESVGDANAEYAKNVICLMADIIWIYTESGTYTDADAFKTAMSGVQLVYKLATPVTYSLTPGQVKTLLGVNNIWADTGDILSVTYPADTKLYIDRCISELQALILESL